MRSCLKVPHLAGLQRSPSSKFVSFSDDDDVHIADEWDRTPTQPTKDLCYHEILEMKAIQNSLPQADQLSDPLTGRPARQFLSKIPITLLPLLSDESASESSQPPPPSTSTSNFPCVPSPPLQPYPTHPNQRKFTFLPLTEHPAPPPRTPSPSLSDDCPTTPSLTDGSLSNSPRDAPGSPPDVSPFIPLPPPKRHVRPPYADLHNPVPPIFLDDDVVADSCGVDFFPPSRGAQVASTVIGQQVKTTPSVQRRKVFYVNGIEFEMDDDDEAEECAHTSSTSEPSAPIPIPSPVGKSGPSPSPLKKPLCILPLSNPVSPSPTKQDLTPSISRSSSSTPRSPLSSPHLLSRCASSSPTSPSITRTSSCSPPAARMSTPPIAACPRKLPSSWSSQVRSPPASPSPPKSLYSSISFHSASNGRRNAAVSVPS